MESTGQCSTCMRRAHGVSLTGGGTYMESSVNSSTETQAKTETETGAGSEADTGAQTGAQSGPETEAAAQTEAGAEARSKAEAEAETKTTATFVFNPSRVYFEPRALEYPLGQKIYEQALSAGLPILMAGSHNRIAGLPGNTPRRRFLEAKRTLVVGVRQGTTFQTSRPSADYALPLATGCPGHCHYCYLNTNLSTKPYVRIYVNLAEILEIADKYARERAPRLTYFDGSCTSDPVAVEHWSHALRTTIEHFARSEFGRFRFVTKFAAVDPLLGLRHNGHTRIRFSVNTRTVASQFEKAVPRVSERLDAAARVASAGYPLGFHISPVIIYHGWKKEYAELLEEIRAKLPRTAPENDLRFEIVAHRFTPRAKQTILEVYPTTRLEMNESQRKWKWGQFGYGKYVYGEETYEEITRFFTENLHRLFPEATLDYVV